MIFHMKRTTLMIDEGCFREIKRLAAKNMRTISDTVNELLRLGLERQRQPAPPRKFTLPSYDMGPFLINIADRDEIERVLRDEP
jgi:hypothetical protein